MLLPLQRLLLQMEWVSQLSFVFLSKDMLEISAHEMGKTSIVTVNNKSNLQRQKEIRILMCASQGIN